jgi:Ca2+ transporting ATPase
MRMKNDKILVRNLNSPETMGAVEEICTGKTNTLTKGDMKVTQFYAQSRLIRITRKNTLFNCELFDNMIQLLIESILFNSDARIEMDDKAFYVPVGNGTDVGMIKFLQDAEVAVHDIIKKKFSRIESIIPLSPDRKRQLVAVRHPDMDDIIRVYVKGAPEKIIDKCTKTYAVDGTRAHLDNDQLNYIKNDIISQQFTSKGYRAIMFAYKDLNIDEFEKLKRQCNNFQTEQDREALENNLCFVAAFALQDELRDKVHRAIQFAQRGQITVRMVSGDHIETAKAFAIKAGIISEAEANDRYCCMTGEEFRNAVGQLRKELDNEGNAKMHIQNI